MIFSISPNHLFRIVPSLLLFVILLLTSGCHEVAADRDGANCHVAELSTQLVTYCDITSEYQSHDCCDSVFAPSQSLPKTDPVFFLENVPTCLDVLFFTADIKRIWKEKSGIIK